MGLLKHSFWHVMLIKLIFKSFPLCNDEQLITHFLHFFSPVVCFPERVGLDHVDHVLRTTNHSGYAIVNNLRLDQNRKHDKNAPPLPEVDNEGQLIGFVLRNDIINIIAGARALFRDPAHEQPEKFDWEWLNHNYPNILEYSAVVMQAKQQYLDFHDILDPGVMQINEEMDLERVYKLVRQYGVRHVIVTDHSANVRGIVTRKDMYQFVNHSWLFRNRPLQRRTRVVKGKETWIVIC